MNNSTLGIAEQIKQLKELLDTGVITQEDYDKKKDELLNGAFCTTNNTPTIYKNDTANVNLDKIVFGEPDYKVLFYKNLDQDLLRKNPYRTLVAKSFGYLDMYFTNDGLVLNSPEWSDIKIEKKLIAYDDLKCIITKTKIMVMFKACFITICVNETSISLFFFENGYMDFSMKLTQKMVGTTKSQEYTLSKAKGNEIIEKLTHYSM